MDGKCSLNIRNIFNEAANIIRSETKSLSYNLRQGGGIDQDFSKKLGYIFNIFITLHKSNYFINSERRYRKIL